MLNSFPVVVAQLTERTLPTTEDLGLNLIIGNFIEHLGN